MNNKNWTYGVNAKGKISLCDKCAYVGYCLKQLHFYSCKNFIKKEITVD